MIRYVFFIGTIAELIKVAPVIVKFRENNTPFIIVASGQNDINKEELLKMIGVSSIDITLSAGPQKQTALHLFLWFLKTTIKGYRLLRYKLCYDKLRPILIVHGDTISTVMGAFLGRLIGAKVAHIEAGLRSYKLFNPFPEEIDRLITSRLAQFHFCPNQWACKNIAGKKEVVDTINNTLIDSLAMARNSGQNVEWELKQPYCIFVVHRQENLFNTPLIRKICDVMLKVANQIEVIFIAHAPTQVVLEKLELWNILNQTPNIRVFARKPYFEFMSLLSSAEFLITDGGSNQEEAYYLGLPCLLLRTRTERIEGLGHNVLLAGQDISVIEKFVHNYKQYKKPMVQPLYSPSNIIFEKLVGNE